MPSGQVIRCLVEQARIAPGHRILDIGCGKAALAVGAKRSEPSADIIALDSSERALRLAQRGIGRAAVPIDLCLAAAANIPLASDSVDCILSCGIFHRCRRW